MSPNFHESGSSRRGQLRLQGPRPAALRVGNSATKTTMTMKKSSKVNNNNNNNNNHPVVIYLRSPKIIHVRPEEFMSLVQRLTGKDSRLQSPPPLPPSACCEDDGESGAEKAVMSKKSAFEEVEFGDHTIGMSPTTWLRFLACV